MRRRFSFFSAVDECQDLAGKKMLSDSLAGAGSVLLHDGGDVVDGQEGEELQIALYIRICRFEEELRTVSNLACLASLGLTYPVELERASHVFVQPDCVSSTFAELGS